MSALHGSFHILLRQLVYCEQDHCSKDSLVICGECDLGFCELHHVRCEICHAWICFKCLVDHEIKCAKKHEVHTDA